MRAEGYTWPEVARAVGYSHKAVRAYTSRPWWQPLYEHFVEAVAIERAERRALAEQERVNRFRERELELVEKGTVMALTTLLTVMRGEPPVDGAGRPVDGWPDSPPSWQTKALAARDFLKVVGYEEAKKYLSRLEVDLARRQSGVGEDEAIEVDVTIMGVDLDDDDDGGTP